MFLDRRPWLVVYLWMVLGLLAVGCNPQPTTQVSPLDSDVSPSATATVVARTEIPTIVPETGKGAMVGRLLTSKDIPMSNSVVRLARVFWDDEHEGGTFVLEAARSPATISDTGGHFVFSNLSPGDYVMVVGEVPDDNVIIADSDGTARIFTVNAGQVADVGDIIVEE